MPVRLRPALLAAAALMVAVLPAGTAQAAGWITGAPLSPAGQVATTPLVATTPGGDRIVAWESQKKADPNTTEGIAIRVAAPGQEFGPTQLLATDSVSDLSLTVGADGTAALAWSGDGALHVARRAAGQASFTEVTALPVADVRSLAAAVDGGAVDLAYETETFNGTGATETITTTIQVARVAAGANAIAAVPGAAMSPLDTATYLESTFAEHTVEQPSIAAAAGAVHVIWEDRADKTATTTASVTTVRRATLAAGAAAFGAPVTIDTISTPSTDADDAQPRIVAGGGRVDAAWTRESAGQVAYENIDAAATVQILPTGTQSFPFGARAGLDGAGALSLAWMNVHTTVFGLAVSGAVVAPTGAPTLGPPLTAANANPQLDDLATGADGSAVVLVDRRVEDSFGSQASDVQASFHAPGAAFGALEDVSGAQDRTGFGRFDNATAAIGPGGNAVAAWAADDGAGAVADRIFFSQRDATPPRFATVAVPATARPATPVALAASATDDLSGATIGWDFGDGSTAQGPSVTHAYGAPGTYTVTATATDGAGNAATRAATIAVATPTGPGGGPAADHTPPVISRLSVTHARFRVSGASTATIARAHRTTKKAPAGTTFKLTLSERATVIVDISSAGRRNRRPATDATLVRGGRTGAVSIAFTGRIGATRLTPGAYTASVTAIDAAGNRSRPRTVKFTVVTR